MEADDQAFYEGSFDDLADEAPPAEAGSDAEEEPGSDGEADEVSPSFPPVGAGDSWGGEGDVILLPPEKWLTSDFLHPNEVGQILAARASQIDQTGITFLPEGKQPAVTAGGRPPAADELALAELKAGCCPLVLWRTRSHTHGQLVVEPRKVRELVFFSE